MLHSIFNLFHCGFKHWWCGVVRHILCERSPQTEVICLRKLQAHFKWLEVSLMYFIIFSLLTESSLHKLCPSSWRINPDTWLMPAKLICNLNYIHSFQLVLYVCHSSVIFPDYTGLLVWAASLCHYHYHYHYISTTMGCGMCDFIQWWIHLITHVGWNCWGRSLMFTRLSVMFILNCLNYH